MAASLSARRSLSLTDGLRHLMATAFRKLSALSALTSRA